MADKLIVNELALEARVGVLEREQEKPQTIWIDLELEINSARAAALDEVGSAVDYADLVASVKKLIEGKSYKLIETVAEEIAALILSQFNTPCVLVRVKKRSLTGIGYAAVEIKRSV